MENFYWSLLVSVEYDRRFLGRQMSKTADLQRSKRLRKCSSCKIEKEISEFYRRNNYDRPSYEYTYYCKVCTRMAVNKRSEANREARRIKDRIWRRENRELHLSNKKKYRDRIRKEVIEKYGGKCKCCGESNLVFLAIDHIDGGGGKHLKQIKYQISIWLRKNNYPSGFQVLCHNCNMAKYILGVCPHAKNR